ncbi:MAG: hypothetical protein F6J93_02040 [Oscillatoria sp. SIO1A7]|nr:hypothetical protein [Oscillatoria sp. SIO1A7]
MKISASYAASALWYNERHSGDRAPPKSDRGPGECQKAPTGQSPGQAIALFFL